MRVRAKHWLNVNGTWFRYGDVFTVSVAEAQKLGCSVEMLEETPISRAEAELWDLGDPIISNTGTVTTETVQEEPKKRRRTSKKTAE